MRYLILLMVAAIVSGMGFGSERALGSTRQGLVAAQKQDLSELEATESWLRSLGLHDRVVDLLEEQLGLERDSGRRSELAVRLAGVYAGRVRGTFDREEQWEQRGRSLMARFSSLEFASLEAALLQVKYGREIEAFERAWETKQVPGRTVATAFERLASEISAFQLRMRSRVAALIERRQLGDAETGFAASGLHDFENAALQSDYLLGWTLYFEAISDADSRASLLSRSALAFRDFLQVDSRGAIAELVGADFDLESGWVALGLVGWSMVLEAQGQVDASSHLFGLVEAGNRQMSTAAVAIFRLKSDVYSGRYRESIETFDGWIEGHAVTAEEKGLIQFAAYRLARGIPDSASVDRKKLESRALVGLVRGGRRGALKRLDQEFGLHRGHAGFYSGWITGFLKLEVDDGEQVDLIEVRHLLSDALMAGGGSADDVARCRLLLGHVEFRLKAYGEAAENFGDAAKVLNEDRQLGAEAIWFQSQALAKVTPGQPENINRALFLLEQLVQDFPDSRWSSKAEFETLRLESLALPPEEAIVRYRAVSESSPDYAMALFEMTRAQYRIWLAAERSGSENVTEAWDELLSLEKKHREHGGVALERKLLGLLMLVGGELRSEAVSLPGLKRWMDTAEELATGLDREAEANAELNYYRLLVGQRLEEDEKAVTAARWLCEHAQGSRFELSGLIYLAGALEAVVVEADSVEPGGPRKPLDELLSVYERLTMILGVDRVQLSGNANARSAYFRLGKARLRVGRWEEAGEVFAQLSEVFPENASYLVELASVRMEQELYEQAKPIWSRVARGVPAGSDTWYRAKIGLIMCLQQSDKREAWKVYRQTRQLSPEIPEPWKTSFDELAKLLSVPKGPGVDE